MLSLTRGAVLEGHGARQTAMSAMAGVQGTKVVVAQQATDSGEYIGRYPAGHPASLLHTYEENIFGGQNVTCRLCLAEEIAAVYSSVNQLISCLTREDKNLREG